MVNAHHKGLRRLFYACCNSADGLLAAWKNEEAFRQEVALAIVLVPAAFWVGENSVQISLLLLSVFLVLIVELLNTCVEMVVDRISIEQHELSRQTKDIASAAVGVSLIALAVVWGVISYARFFA
ncbi:MAG: diacylglycerol kinase [Gammaproteobacteria bacterium]|nr:diacylglycerol kinase [Gammaproteobacteria bacterium]